MLKYIFAVIFIALAWAAVIVFEELPIELAVWTTVIVVVGLVLFVLLRWLLARRAAGKIESALASSGAADDGLRPEVRAQIDEMNAEFQKALRTLRSSKLGKHGRSALAALPWYVIIGPPGSGKSTLLRNSGLKFPYLNAKRGAVRGVGGTRNCDWWLANEGILLDTAGRWSTEEDDQDEWLAFLDLLKRTRKGRPLNGIMIGMSAGELLETAADELPALAKKLRERIDEVMKRLEVTLPVYLVVTKCDLIGGFVETFGTLGEKERGQIWGLTLPLETGDAARPEMFVERLDRLVDTLETRSLLRLKAENRPEITRRLYEFPQQFEELCPSLVDLVNDLFSENAYQDSPILRGVYFTSATQEGRPIDRVVQRMAQAIGLAPVADYQPVLKAKSYFLRDVFRSVIFPDQNVAGQGEKAIKRRKYMGFAAAGAAFLGAFGIALMPVSAYTANLSFARAVREWGETLSLNRAPNGGEQQPTAELDNLYETSQRLKRFVVEGPETGMRFGFYQGDKLEPLIGRVGRDQVARPTLQQDIIAMNLFADSPGRTFDEAVAALRLHLLLTGPKNPNEPRPGRGGDNWDEGVAEARKLAVERWKQHLVGKNMAPAPRSEQVIGDAIELYLRRAERTPELFEPRNNETVARTRKALCDIVTKDPLQQILSLPEFDQFAISLNTLFGGSITLFKDTAKIHGAFTRQGWQEVKRRLEAKAGGVEGDREWALGGCEALPAETIRKIRRDYVEKYEQAWRAFIGAVQPKQEADFIAAEQLLRRYVEDKPLAALWKSIGENIPIDLNQGPAIPEKVVPSRLRQIAGRVLPAVRNAIGGAEAVEEKAALNSVEPKFRELIDFGVAKKEGTPTLLDAYYGQLRQVVNALKIYADSRDVKPLRGELNRAKREVEEIIAQAPARLTWQTELNRMLFDPLKMLNVQAEQQGYNSANDSWCDGVISLWDATLSEYYPFRASGADAQIPAVEKFFHPQQGALWQYVQTALAADLEPQTFRARPTASVPYSSVLSNYLKRAKVASELLFYRGSPTLSVPLQARIWPAGTGVSQIVMRFGAQRIMHRNEGERFQTLTWPARDLSVEIHANSGFINVPAEGEWALFRFIDKAARVAFNRDEREFFLRTEYPEVGPGLSLQIDWKPSNLRDALRNLVPPYVVAPGRSKCAR